MSGSANRKKKKARETTCEAMRDYLKSRSYVPGVIGGWVSEYVPMQGERWTFYSKDRRRRASDDYSLEMAYALAIEGRFAK